MNSASSSIATIRGFIIPHSFVLRPDRCGCAGKFERKCRALADLRLFQIYPAAVLLDDLADYKEPEPGALARLLGRKERIKELLYLLLRNTGAGVLNVEDDLMVILSGRDRDPPGLSYSLTGVPYKVEEDFLELLPIDEDTRQVNLELFLDLYLLEP